MFDVAYSKATGKYSSRPVYESKEYSFLDGMMKDVVNQKLGQRKKECASFKLPGSGKKFDTILKHWYILNSLRTPLVLPQLP